MMRASAFPEMPGGFKFALHHHLQVVMQCKLESAGPCPKSGPCPKARTSRRRGQLTHARRALTGTQTSLYAVPSAHTWLNENMRKPSSS